MDTTTGTGMRRVAGAVPLIIAAQIALAWVLLAIGGELRPAMLGIGAAGWVAALVLRMPFIALARRLLPDDRTFSRVLVWLSGPAEEGLRVVLLLLLADDVSDAVSLGIGWGAIEAVYGIANGVAMLVLASRDDEKAAEARAKLAEMGISLDTPPLWGMAERASATTVHVGFALLLFWEPWLVVLAMPLHSAMNSGFMRLVRAGMPQAQVALAVFAVLLAGVGFALAGTG